ncbi:Na(+)/dicarboxylate cotransporter 3 isoform 1-T1 [Syngnathus typhle]
MSVVAKKLWCVHKALVLFITPLLFSPLLVTLPEKEGRCLYVVVLMATFWCSEALPLAVTAMLPICLFPTLGIIPSQKLCPQYFLETNFLFLSGLVLASSIEEWGLHRRIALKVLTIVGVKPAWLILGMMTTSSFLSMWLSNTATTAMMLPIANAILETLFGDLESLKQKCMPHAPEDCKRDVARGPSIKMRSLPSVASEKQKLSLEGSGAAAEENDARTAEEIRSESEYQMSVWKGFLVCIPYAASIGGTATLTGTAPNLILIGQLKNYFPECDLINFGSWFAFAFPLMLVFLLLGWLWIAFLHGGLRARSKQQQRAEEEARARALVEEDYRKLGPLNFAEGAVAFFFTTYAVLLFTRDPKFVTGWSALFKKGYVSDAVTGVIIVSVLFFFPSQKPSLSWWLDPKGLPREREPPVLHDPCHGRELVRFHAARGHAAQLHRLRLRSPSGQRHGENWLCHEHPGSAVRGAGHQHVGPGHVPAGRLPRLGSPSQPLCRLHVKCHALMARREDNAGGRQCSALTVCS